MKIAITKMSSKGQIVIPAEMRKGLKEGETLLILRMGDQFLLKRASDLGKNFKQELAFAQKKEAAWRKYERGEFTSSSAQEFLDELEKW